MNNKYLVWIKIFISTRKSDINSYAGGLAVARPYDFEIDFVRDTIFGSAAWFFVIILKFIFTVISEIKIHEKNSLTTKNFIFINQLNDIQLNNRKFHSIPPA